MEAALIILKQTTVMFIYMFAGYILFKTEKMTIKGSRDIASLLVWLVIPTVIVNSFCVEFSREKLMDLVVSSLLGALSLVIAMTLSAIICKRNPVDNFGCAFSNAGFIGIPLVQAALGDEAVFYIVGMIAMLNLLQWSYGVGLLTGEKSAVGLRHLLLNPIMVGTAIGILIFVTGLGSRLPGVISTSLKGISALNAPLAMIVLGSYLAQSDIRRMLSSAHLYFVSAVRLLIIPVITILVFSLLPADDNLIMAIIIAASAPIGANVAVYAQLYDRDYPYACQTVAMSTILSIITLPLLMMAADLLI